ncbi:MAG: hypothetical protein Q9171_005597 [Xanthocarpia ochracea]
MGWCHAPKEQSGSSDQAVPDICAIIRQKSRVFQLTIAAFVFELLLLQARPKYIIGNEERSLASHHEKVSMHTPVTGTCSTDTSSLIISEALSEDQIQSSVVTLDDQIGEKSPAAKPEDEEEAVLTDNGNNDGTPNQDSRVQYVKSEFKDNGDRHEVPGKRTSTTISSTKEGSNIAFVIQEYWNEQKIKERTEILLKGRDLRGVMHKAYGKHLEHCQIKNWLEQEQTICQPFFNELWYWNELCDAAKSDCGSKQGREDLQLLLDHLLDIEPDGIKLAKSTISLTRVSAKDLWILFRPGTEVVSKPYLDEPQLFRVQSLVSRNDTPFVVGAWTLGWTGTELIRECYEFTVRRYEKDDEKLTITELDCYPVIYYTSGDGTRGRKALEAEMGLTERGRVFRNLCRESKNGRYHAYVGELLYDPQPVVTMDNFPELFVRTVIEGNIMIDFAAYKQYSPGGGGALGSLEPEEDAACKCQLCLDSTSNFSQWMRRFANEDMGNSSADDDINYFFLPARLLGYCFNTKIWAQFHVNRVKAINISNAKKEMEKLKFPEELDSVKEDLRILIQLHGKTELPMIVDPIEGKGAGLVVLLHGPPGVGKTLTAETLAKCAGKPLYCVGASDVGLVPKTAEESLGRIFDLAERWGAVLLIDEADVFLDSRGSRGEGDLSKNALVSVNFKPLTHEQEQDIWQGYIKQLTSENSTGKGEIEAWVYEITKKTKNSRTRLSGREVRNVFTTAQTLAQAEPNKKIQKKHLERVYDRIMDFAEEMKVNKTKQEVLLNARYS